MIKRSINKEPKNKLTDQKRTQLEKTLVLSHSHLHQKDQLYSDKIAFQSKLYRSGTI